MTRIKTIAAGLLIAMATATVAVPASAHGVNARQAEQARLIEQGRQDGTITFFEGLRLRREQRRIEKLEEQLRSDGRLSRADRRELHARLNEAMDNIDKQLNDRWRRARFLPRVGY